MEIMTLMVRILIKYYQVHTYINIHFFVYECLNLYIKIFIDNIDVMIIF
jgi:hypothetical protein